MAQQSRGAAQVSELVRGREKEKREKRERKGEREKERERERPQEKGWTTPACVKVCSTLTINNGDVGVY